MTYRILFLSAIALAISLIVATICGSSILTITLIGAALLLALALTFQAVTKPLEAIKSGFDLLRSQDFNSRLRKTGQTDADKVIAIFNQMMATMKAERLKLMEQELFLGKLIEVSPLGIAICDFDDNIIKSNPIFRKIQNPELLSILASLNPDETRVLRLASSQIYRCARLWFMDSGFRRTFYIIEILTDDIIKSERAVFNTIIRTIGHEVNNTLGSVISVLDSINEIHNADESIGAALTGTRESCSNLVAFVGGYASVVKLPSPIRTPVDIAAEVSRMVPLFQSVISPNIKLKVDITAPGPSILDIDIMLMERALLNIVKNAAESIGNKPGGEIVIRIEKSGLKIIDNGQGIADDISSKIFTPFFSTKRPDRGLGLMLVTDILRGHGAAFSLYTDRSSGLTMFDIQF